MNRHLAITAAAALAAAAVMASSPAGAVTRLSSRGMATGKTAQVPGPGPLNTTPGAVGLYSVSCASAGNCGAGGDYTDAAFLTQALVVSEVNGVWGRAEEVPGTGALNTAGLAEVDSVSCASAGNCSAGGYYTGDAARADQQAFVASEVNGTWGTAEEVPGTARLNQGGDAFVTSVSCASAGNCSAAGHYTGSSGNGQTFVVSEVNGIWGQAAEVPGTARLNQGGDAFVTSVSCASAGNCSAAGIYTDGSNAVQGFIVNQVGGTWADAAEIPGLGPLNQGKQAWPNGVSCASPGNCGAGGYYTDHARNQQAFVVSEANGVWGKAVEVPGTARLNHLYAGVGSVSCTSAGDCSAAGAYSGGPGAEPFVVSEVNGVWGKAKEVPGIAKLNQAYASARSVSCASPGNCAVGGVYASTPRHHHQQVFVVSQVNGAWGKAKEVPGSGALNKDHYASFSTVSCASAGNCSAAGGYYDGSDNAQGFVVSQDNGVWDTAQEIIGPIKST